MFSNLSAEELERRRNLSILAMDQIRKDAFERMQQERLDTLYWANGPCCAGCDHWAYAGGKIGQCLKSPILSGNDVLRSMGWVGSTLQIAPDHPYTDQDHLCGLFEDKFDWTTLDETYLKRIGWELYR